MTLEEMQKVADIVGTAGHGNEILVGQLIDQLAAAFPEFDFFEAELDESELPDGMDYRPVKVSVSLMSQG